MSGIIIQKNTSDILNLMLFIFAFTSIPFLVVDRSLPNLPFYMATSIILSLLWFFYSLVTFNNHVDFNMKLPPIIYVGIITAMGIIASIVMVDIINDIIITNITLQLIGLFGTLTCCAWLSYFIITKA